MGASVPEHISLYPRDTLESLFNQAGFKVSERFSANVGHFFYFPKDYILLLRNTPKKRGLFLFATAWNRLSKISPFYPWPFQALRLMATYLWGGSS